MGSEKYQLWSLIGMDPPPPMYGGIFRQGHLIWVWVRVPGKNHISYISSDVGIGW